MQVNRTPFDALNFTADALFLRWEAELQAINVELQQPMPDEYESGAQAGDPRFDAWCAEVRKRRNRLQPLAAEMATAHLRRFDHNQRAQSARLLENYRYVVWQWTGVIDDYFDRFLQSWALYDFEIICALIAIYDLRAQSKDFSLMAYPFYLGLKRRGVDPVPLFALGLSLATPYADPERGAYAFFVRYSTPYPDNSSTKSV